MQHECEGGAQGTVRKNPHAVLLGYASDELGYLLRVLRNTYVSRLRAANRRPQTAELLDERHPPETRTAFRPDEAYEAAEVYADSIRPQP